MVLQEQRSWHPRGVKKFRYSFVNFSTIFFFTRFNKEGLEWGINETTTGIHYDFEFRKIVREYPVYPGDKIFEQLQNTSFRGAVVYNQLDLTAFNYKVPQDEKRSFNSLEKRVMSYNLGVVIQRKKNYLASTLKRKVDQLIQAGFFNHWMNKYKSHQSLIKRDLEEVKVVLTMDHLSVGFTLWLAVLLIASIAFATEFTRIYLRNFICSLKIFSEFFINRLTIIEELTQT